MIIRATFHNNDFIGVLEKYFDKFIFVNYYAYIKTIQDPLEYRDRQIEAEDLITKIFYKANEVTKEDLKLFKQILLQSIKSYIKENVAKEDQDYLMKELKISLRKTCEDKWENGEVLYYFITKGKYIIM